MPPRRLVTLVSVALHAVAIAAIVVAQLLAVGPLPAVHRPLAFDNATFVVMKDIELPAVPRATTQAAPSATASPNAAPLEAPSGVSEETGLENVSVPTTTRPDLNGVEGGGVGLEGALEGGRVALPPPPPPTPTAPVRLHEGMQPPRKIVDATPVYPTVARTARVEGIVILEAVIDAKGRVETVRVLRSIPLLDQAAVDAVRQWRFTPTLLNKVPVPIVMTVTVNFTLQ